MAFLNQLPIAVVLSLAAGVAAINTAAAPFRTLSMHGAVKSSDIYLDNGVEYNRKTLAPVPSDLYTGKYREIRAKLDHTYHGVYTHDRQAQQDQLVDNMLAAGGDKSSHPWIIFSAGPMGAGKGHTINYLNENGFNPIPKFVSIDPDKLRVQLPEWNDFAKDNQLTAGDRTQHEVGCIQEIATEAALQSGKNIFVDGSLSDSGWFSKVFAGIRSRFPQYHIAITYVGADPDVIRGRVTARAKEEGRDVPEKTLKYSIENAPASFAVLEPLADFAITVDNSFDNADPTVTSMSRNGQDIDIRDLDGHEIDIRDLDIGQQSQISRDNLLLVSGSEKA